MFKIERRKIKREIKQPNAKSEMGIDNELVSEQWKLEMWNVLDKAQKLSVYNLGNWIIFHDRWLTNLTSPENRKKYSYGDIVMADLGATNFKYEPQYEHPCIILVNDLTSVLVVPCSSKKYGQGFPEVIDATTADGFSVNTGIQMNCIRWIHKNRITETVGSILNPALMKQIDEYIIKQFPSYHDLSAAHTKEVEILKEQINIFEEQKQKLEEDKADYASRLEIYRELLQSLLLIPEVSNSLKEVASAKGFDLNLF